MLVERDVLKRDCDPEAKPASYIGLLIALGSRMGEVGALTLVLVKAPALSSRKHT